ncbi:hypothetical protein [uncultured Gemmiger sp.]|uniref:hypothetical protein n=1 Tax=uncultured Gemmiger sp. TaxID=1623490 RepID=UPI0025E383D4|nr:hypothetical protein [uncultured Gemmiger sp.]
MNININIRAESADDYKAAIKALMDGAGMVGFEIPGLTLPAPRSGIVKAQQQADAEAQMRKTLQPKQQTAVEAPVPSAEELPIEAPKAAQKPAGDWTPGGGKQAEDVPAVTLDELQAIARKMALAGRMEHVRAILKKYDAPKITALPAETWAAVKAELEAANG